MKVDGAQHHELCKRRVLPCATAGPAGSVPLLRLAPAAGAGAALCCAARAAHRGGVSHGRAQAAGARA